MPKARKSGKQTRSRRPSAVRTIIDASGQIVVDGKTRHAAEPEFISRPYLAPLGVSPARMKRIGRAVERAANEKNASKAR